MNEADGLSPELEERLARYRAGGMDEPERAAFESEVLANDALAEALYREVSLDALLPHEAQARAAAPGPGPTGVVQAHARRRGVLPLPLARLLLPVAAVLVAISSVVLWSGRHRPDAPLDEALRGGSGALVLLEPAGSLDQPPRVFRWSRDPGAASYRVELYDAHARRLGTVVTADTVVALGALSRAPVAAGEWRVVALGADGLERAARARAAFTSSR